MKSKGIMRTKMDAVDDGWPNANHTLVHVERNGTKVKVNIKGMTNHELREVLVGLWNTLDDDDRIDHIKELTHYQYDAGAWLSPLAQGISQSRVRNGEETDYH